MYKCKIIGRLLDLPIGVNCNINVRVLVDYMIYPLVLTVI